MPVLMFVQKLPAFVKKTEVADTKLAEVFIFDNQSGDRRGPGIKNARLFVLAPACVIFVKNEMDIKIFVKQASRGKVYFDYIAVKIENRP